MKKRGMRETELADTLPHRSVCQNRSVCQILRGTRATGEVVSRLDSTASINQN